MPRVTFLHPQGQKRDGSQEYHVARCGKGTRVSAESRLWGKCLLHHLPGRGPAGCASICPRSTSKNRISWIGKR